MYPLNIDKGWIFSFKEDIALIFTILLLGVLFYEPFLISDNLTPIKVIQIAIFAQLPHAAAVYIVSYGSKEERQQHKKFLTLSPIISIALITGFFFYDRIVLLYINAAFDCFHFFRQQYGVEMVTMRKGRVLRPIEAKFNEVFFYATTIIPAFYFITKQDFPIGWQGVTLSNVFSGYSNLFLGVICIIYLAFILLELREIFLYKTFNLAKWLHCALSIFVWLVCPIYFNSYLAVGAFLLIQHSVYSWYFCFKRFQAWDRGVNSKYNKLIQSKLGPFIFYLMTFSITAFGIFIIKFERYLFDRVDNQYYEHIALTAILGMAFIWNHYWIDAIIWKKKNRKNYQQILS